MISIEQVNGKMHTIKFKGLVCMITRLIESFKSLLLTLSLILIAMFAISTPTTAQIPLQNQFKNVDLELRAKIAQKLFLDLRYYCVPKAQGYCQEPLLELPDELAFMLSQSKVGGVILFSENLANPKQIVELVHQLQTSQIPQSLKDAMLSANPADPKSAKPQRNSYQPLYIGIDQEGGRVSRLPQDAFLGFAGNMAIGATAKEHKNIFASASATAIAEHLNMLGINVNFAPVLDVNNNPQNPIINVRAYAQFPKLVAELGASAIKAMQAKDIAVAAKHFPGHGDTHIDSHVGLPRVEHSREMINKIDLYPFRSVIANHSSRPDMIMTAHIQYPELDNTPFANYNNTKGANSKNESESTETVVPATLSKKILTGILRDEYAYDGLIVTDALDMKSITHYLSPIDAVIQSFRAGADITLMPYHISSPEDAIGFLDWLNELTIFISQDNDLRALVDASYNRILKHKAKRNLAKRALLPLEEKLAKLKNPLYQDANKSLAEALSRASFTKIKQLQSPLSAEQKLLALMPDKLRCEAFTVYWQKLSENTTISCVSMLSQRIPNKESIDEIDAIVVGDVSPQLAFYESSAHENITADERKDMLEQHRKLTTLLASAKAQNKPRVLIKMRSPYISLEDLALYNGIFASYDYQVVISSDAKNVLDETNIGAENKNASSPGNLYSPAFESIVKVITGKQKALGSLPVSLSSEVIEQLPELKLHKEISPVTAQQ